VRSNSLRELNYINGLRVAGIPKTLISDEELISITQLSRDSYFKRRKQQNVSLSHSGTREFKEVTSILINKKISTVAVTKVDSSKGAS
jgi:hypothetical protein